MGRKTISTGRAAWLSAAAALVVAAGLVSAPIITSVATAAPAAAQDTDTYSWPNAPCAWTGSTTGKCVNPSQRNNTSYWYDWGVTSCPSGDSNCSSTLNGYIRYDPWGYKFRNSTSYVAEKISQKFNGRSLAGWGQASNWKKAAQSAGYKVESSPHVGDIAGWNAVYAPPFGQVGYVYAVVNGVAYFDQYNADQTGLFSSNYTSRTGPYGSPDWYIHMGTPATGPTPTPTSTSPSPAPSPTPTTTSPTPTPTTTSPSPTPTGTSTSPYGASTAWVVGVTGTFAPINTVTNTAGSPVASTGPYATFAAVALNGTGYAGWTSAAGGGHGVRPVNLNNGTVYNGWINATSPADVAITADGTTAYMVDRVAGTVTPINTTTQATGTPIPVGSSPEKMVITPAGTTGYVILQSSASVVPVNLATGAVGAPIPVGGTPLNLAITRDGATVWVENQSAGTLVPISTATNTAGTQIPVGSLTDSSYNGAFAITPDGATAYVLANGTNRTSPVLVPVNLATGTLGAGISVGGPPSGVAITPDGTTAYVVDAGYPTSTVVPVNLATNTAGPAIPVDVNQAQFIVFPS